MQDKIKENLNKLIKNNKKFKKEELFINNIQVTKIKINEENLNPIVEDFYFIYKIYCFKLKIKANFVLKNFKKIDIYTCYQEPSSSSTLFNGFIVFYQNDFFTVFYEGPVILGQKRKLNILREEYYKLEK